MFDGNVKLQQHILNTQPSNISSSPASGSQCYVPRWPVEILIDEKRATLAATAQPGRQETVTPTELVQSHSLLLNIYIIYFNIMIYWGNMINSIVMWTHVQR
jgi:hypothetical protein